MEQNEHGGRHSVDGAADLDQHILLEASDIKAIEEILAK